MKLLDMCCGAGGASVGYWRAGFDVTGVDKVPQPFYPFPFVLTDALTLDYDFLMSFDAIHASPPCQEYSCSTASARKNGKHYPDLFIPFRRTLIASGLPYVIENVQGSPAHGIGLCGTMFGLGVRRHRLFESNVRLALPDVPCSCYAHRGEFVTVAGSMFKKSDGAAAMGIDWSIDKFQLKEAIPPSYTEFIGVQLRNAIEQLVRNENTSTTRNDKRLVLTVSEFPGDSVSEFPGDSVSEAQRISVSNEAWAVPVTQRCAYCKTPLPTSGTARKKYCNDLCRLRSFRERNN